MSTMTPDFTYVASELEIQSRGDFTIINPGWEHDTEPPLYNWEIERQQADYAHWLDRLEETGRKDYLLDKQGTVMATRATDEIFHSVTITLPTDHIEGTWRQIDVDEPAPGPGYLTAAQNRMRIAALNLLESRGPEGPKPPLQEPEFDPDEFELLPEPEEIPFDDTLADLDI